MFAFVPIYRECLQTLFETRERFPERLLFTLCRELARSFEETPAPPREYFARWRPWLWESLGRFVCGGLGFSGRWSFRSHSFRFSSFRLSPLRSTIGRLANVPEVRDVPNVLSTGCVPVRLAHRDAGW